MSIELSINGLFDMSFYNPHNGKEVEEWVEQGILDNLQQGEYVIGINTKTVVDINDMQTVLYTFELEATDAVDYEFDEL